MEAKEGNGRVDHMEMLSVLDSPLKLRDSRRHGSVATIHQTPARGQEQTRKNIWGYSEFVALLFLFLGHTLDDVRMFWLKFYLGSYNALLKSETQGYWSQILWMCLFLQKRWLPQSFDTLSLVLQKQCTQFAYPGFNQMQVTNTILLKSLLSTDWKYEFKSRILCHRRWKAGNFMNFLQVSILQEKLCHSLSQALKVDYPDRNNINDAILAAEEEGSILFSCHTVKNLKSPHPCRWILHVWHSVTGRSLGTIAPPILLGPTADTAVHQGFATLHGYTPTFSKRLSSINMVGGAYHDLTNIILWSTAGADCMKIHVGTMELIGPPSDISRKPGPVRRAATFNDHRMRQTRTHQDATVPIEPFGMIKMSDDGMIVVAKSRKPSRRLVYFHLAEVFDCSEVVPGDDDQVITKDSRSQHELSMEWIWSGAHSLPISSFSVLGCCSSTSSRDEDRIGFACKLLTTDEGGNICLWRLNADRIFWMERKVSVDASLTGICWLPRYPHKNHTKPHLTTLFQRSTDSNSEFSEPSFSDESDGSSFPSVQNEMQPPPDEAIIEQASEESSELTVPFQSQRRQYDDFLDSDVFSQNSDSDEHDVVPTTEIIEIESDAISPEEDNNEEVVIGCPLSRSEWSNIRIPSFKKTIDLSYLQCPDFYETSHRNPHLFVTASETGVLALHDARDLKSDGRAIVKLRYHTSPIVQLDCGGPNFDMIVSLDVDGKLAIWNLNDCSEPANVYHLPDIVRGKQSFTNTLCIGVAAPSWSGLLKTNALVPYGYLRRFDGNRRCLSSPLDDSPVRKIMPEPSASISRELPFSETCINHDTSSESPRKSTPPHVVNSTNLRTVSYSEIEEDDDDTTSKQGEHQTEYLAWWEHPLRHKSSLKSRRQKLVAPVYRSDDRSEESPNRSSPKKDRRDFTVYSYVDQRKRLDDNNTTRGYVLSTSSSHLTIIATTEQMGTTYPKDTFDHMNMMIGFF